MKLTLMIEASATVIARVLAAIGDDEPGVTVTTTGGTEIDLPVGASVALNSDHEPVITAPTGTLIQATGDSEDGPVDVGAPDVDSTGLPWDERIHAKTKATVAGGVWRAKRGVDQALVDSVTAELRAKAAPMPPMQPEPVPQPVAMPAMQPVPMPQMQPLPMPSTMPDLVAAAPAPVALPIEPAAPVQISPADFMVKLGALMGGDSPVVDSDYLTILTNRFNQAYGTVYNAITDAMMNPQHLSLVVQTMQQDGRWTA